MWNATASCLEIGYILTQLYITLSSTDQLTCLQLTSRRGTITSTLNLGGTVGMRQIKTSCCALFDIVQDCILKLNRKQYERLCRADLFRNMSSSKTEYTLKLNERKSVTASLYDGHVYFHIRDAKKQKSVSLTVDELSKLYKKTTQLLHQAKRIIKSSKTGKKRSKAGKKSHNKKRSQEVTTSESSSASSDSDEDIADENNNDNE